MSTTPETDAEFTAGLIADALVAEARATSGHRRLFLGGFLGLPPAAVFAALRERIDPDNRVTVTGGREAVVLQGVALGETDAGTRLLVPYLVGEPGPNSGSAGFAALLRDEVPSGDAQRVLLILDESPVETVRTAAEDAATLPRLAWRQLARAATDGAVDGVAALLAAVLKDDEATSRLPRTYAALGSLKRLAAMPDAVQAGMNLHSLGCFLADPEAHRDPDRRLRRGADMRVRLEGWAAPGQDLEGALVARYEDPADAGLARVLAAVTPFGLDYAGFTLDDLHEDRRPSRAVRLAYPLATPGAACASLGTRAAIWKAGGGSFGVSLSGAATGQALASITWSDGKREEIVIAPGDREVTITADGRGWRFARLNLADQTAELAVFLDPGGWAPFEATLDVDPGISAFRCAGEPRLLALGPGGELLGQPTLQRANGDMGSGEPEQCLALMAGQEHPIHLLISAGAEDNEETEDPDHRDEDEEGDTDAESLVDVEEGADDESPEPEPTPKPGANAPKAASVPHARLKASQNGQELGTSSFRVTLHDERGLLGNILTPGFFELAPQELSAGVDGLQLEQQILARPEVTAFTLIRTGGGAASLDRHPYLDSLILRDLPGGALKALADARAALFSLLAPYGSVHAVAAGVAIDEARQYVEAYQGLLAELLEGGRFLAEYERVFLYDAVADPWSGELLIAPTNPLSVAYLIELGEQVERWLPRAEEVIGRDLDGLTMRHLIPYFHVQGSWYETGAPAPLLWRRYRVAAGGASGEHRPRYIARRIKHFLRVHPEYGDERQVLALAFHEPGDGATVLEALRDLARPLARPGALLSARSDGARFPRLAVTIVTSSDSRTLVEALASGELASPELDVATDRLLRDRIDVKRVQPGDGPDFAHLSFVFESSLERQPSTVDVDARAGTLFVGGLAAVPGRHIEPGRNETTFMWGTFVGADQPGILPDLTRRLLELVSGMPRDPIAAGRTRMPSTRTGSAFLGDLYDGSAWVVHLDKLLGLEAFAPDATGRHARYLIDYEDRLDLAQPGLDAITATSRVEPYRLALRQALAGLGKPTEPGLDRMLQLFNGVSGRWALDLVGANPNDLHERIGLAAAIASLQDLDGGLHSDGTVGLVLPLDEVLDALPREARPSKDRLCDDLLYVRLPLVAERPVLRGRLLEVKYRGSTDAGVAEVARQQLERAHSWLLDAFTDEASPQRPFRSRDLAELLRAAATRASAFGLLDRPSRAALEPVLDAVARGLFDLRLDYRAGGEHLEGDFVSIEADSAAPAHRQPLPGNGLALGHLRLGRPALEALAAGKPLPRPGHLASPSYEGSGTGGAGSEDGEQGPGGGAGPSLGGPQPPTPAGGAQATARAQVAGEVLIMAARLDAAFAKHGLAVEPFAPDLAQVGPSVVRFRTRTLGKLSIAEVERRARDIGREIAAPGEVQIGDEPGFVTVDVPRADREAVLLSTVLAALDREPGKPGALQFVAGVAPSGQVRTADLSRLPHLLVAGATGSGKSVFLRGLLVELLRARTADQLNLMIVDPKRLDFAPFARAPHVRGQAIISDPDEALERLTSTLRDEIDLRQPILEKAGVSSAAEFYESGGRLEDLPQLVILVDEFADLVLAGSDRKAFSELVQRYAQLTRAYGIFLVLATQRPSVDVVTGSIKANLSARIAFSLPSSRDSMTVLDRGGAEDLLGDGDLLFYRNGRIERLQAPLATLADVRTVIPE